MNLDVLVLAAGKSTRISPVSAGEPKPLLSLGGRRLIEWSLTWLASHGVRSVWINLHYRPESIRAVVGTGERYGLRVRYSHEPEILGTAGGWRRVVFGTDAAADGGGAGVRGGGAGTWLVVYGDNVMRFDLAHFVAAHRAYGGLATIALFDPSVHANTGIAGGRVGIADDGRITEFREGAPAGPGPPSLVNAGAYLLEREVADSVAEGFQDFGRDVFPALLGTGRVYGHVLERRGFCLGLDTPESYRVAQSLVEGGEVVLR